MKQILWKINTLVTNMEKIIVGTGVLTATFLIFYNVILRQFSARSLAWAEELTRYIMIWVTFFGANLCIQNNVHVKMDLLHIKLPAKAAKWIVSLTYVICIIGCVFLALTGYTLTLQIARLGQISSSMPWLKMWLVNICSPIFAVIGMKDYTWLLVLNILDREKIIKETGGKVS